MDVKQKELVSLGASVSAHCFPCFDFHLQEARKLGIDEEDIREAVRAGFMVMNGAGDKMWEKIREILSGMTLEKELSCSNKMGKEKAFFPIPVRF